MSRLLDTSDTGLTVFFQRGLSDNVYLVTAAFQISQN